MRTLLLFLLWIFLVSPQGRTQDWRLQNSGTNQQLNKIFFVDTLRGWAVGEQGTILHTTDGGEQWTKQVSPDTNASYKSVFFTDERNGWVVGFRIIIRTTNGGEQWIKQNFSLQRKFNDVFFANQDTGWIIGGSATGGLIMRTIDKGNSWKILRDSSGGGSFYGIHFIDNREGWLVGFNGFDNSDSSIIIHTTNSGEFWVNQPSAVIGGLRDVSFQNSQIGWAVGPWGFIGGTSYTMVIKTVDGGTNWEPSGPFPNVIGGFVALESVDSLLLIGNADPRNPSIFRSLDGGTITTWMRDSIEFPSPITNIKCVDVHYCWSCGNNGSIWKYHPKITSIVPIPESQTSDIAIAMYLSPKQNIVRIAYKLKKSLAVRTDVYNLFGSSLYSTLATVYPEGAHIITINLSGVPKGMYILRTIADEQVNFSKFMIVY